MVSFCLNLKKYELKIYRGVLCHDNETMKNDAKFEEELTFQFKIDMRNLTKFDPSTQPSFEQSI